VFNCSYTQFFISISERLHDWKRTPAVERNQQKSEINRGQCVI
jgi:hypothetical protein